MPRKEQGLLGESAAKRWGWTSIPLVVPVVPVLVLVNLDPVVTGPRNPLVVPGPVIPSLVLLM